MPEPAADMKICTKCGAEKPATVEFFYFKKQKGKLGSWCKACEYQQDQRWHARNPEKVKKSEKASRDKNADQVKSSMKDWRQRNAEKIRRDWRKWYSKNTTRVRHHRLKSLYGLTPEQYEGMFAAQASGCAICRRNPYEQGDSKGLFVDHDHVTGRVRALLCQHCNRLLGCAKDSAEILLSAAAYLRQHQQDEEEDTE